ncbi:unnamed protein product, partial [Vitis vinifera]
MSRGGIPTSTVPSSICVTFFIDGLRIGSGWTHHNPTNAILSNLLKSSNTSESCPTSFSSFPEIRQLRTQSMITKSSSSVSSSTRLNSICLLAQIISSSITPKL